MIHNVANQLSRQSSTLRESKRDNWFQKVVSLSTVMSLSTKGPVEQRTAAAVTQVLSPLEIDAIVTHNEECNGQNFLKEGKSTKRKHAVDNFLTIQSGKSILKQPR
jgi:hypothetical protein